MDWHCSNLFFRRVDSDGGGGGRKGFKAFIWVNKLIDGLIDGTNKSPIISLTGGESLSEAVSCPN